MSSYRWRGCTVLLATAFLLLSAPALFAQFTLPGLGGDPLGGGDEPPKVEVKAVFTAATAGQPARLFVTADIVPGFHIYSITQKPGGPAATKIILESSQHYRAAGPFQASAKPKVHYENQIWPNLPLEEHEGKITWSAPLEIAAGIDPSGLQISGKLDLQVCDPNTCIPQTLPFKAQLTAKPPVESPAPAAVGEYRPEDASVALRGFVSPAVVAPGDTVHLVLTAMPDQDWHVYALESRDPQIVGRGKPTVIAIEQTGGLQVESISTNAPIIEKASELAGVGVETYHEGEVTWTVNLQVPADAPPGPVTIGGLIGYQACFASGCKPPMGARFQADLTIGPAAAVDEAPLGFERASYTQAARASEAQPIPIVGPSNAAPPASIPNSLAKMLVFGFLGGLVLNLMPCVLPVIGLKVMSFVEQAGQSRHEAFVLNLWYSGGILAVFLILAGLAVVLGLTWGEQFGNDGFNIVLAAIVFAMALSLLGVWEIPIPGFVGSSKAHEIASQEGPFGAFCKGIITTVLATPCTGPFMGTALAWAVLQPAAYTFSVFASIGLGMASPYLLIGAFPVLIRFLPKPGAWMDTFKQIMGFVLMGTVIFLLTFIDYALVVPTILLLTGIGAACWWINRTPPYEPLAIRLQAWAGGVAFAALIGYIAFAHSIGTLPKIGTIPGLRGVMESRLNRYLAQHGGAPLKHEEGELPWQPFTPEKLAELHRERRTVLVDFTADWCLICKTLEQTVLNTEPVREAVRVNQVETLVADYTKRPTAIKEMLRQLESNGVPVVAIYPAGNPHQPIVFRGAYTQSAILEALQQAGPSQGAAIETAMRE